MLKRGDSIADIVDITELSKEKVIQLKKKYQKLSIDVMNVASNLNTLWM
ncbi:hypothetical protein ACJDU8_16300 [Clostridium sp. WILCCON 0269]|uniref:Uncharacterized protein n=1 Tax=Candidatus Clostridium eludens TaxID=3381663 RepID=A0ABW8SM31_9CLOT